MRALGTWTCASDPSDELVLEDLISLERPLLMLAIQSDAGGDANACVTLTPADVMRLRGALRTWLLGVGYRS